MFRKIASPSLALWTAILLGCAGRQAAVDRPEEKWAEIDLPEQFEGRIQFQPLGDKPLITIPAPFGTVTVACDALRGELSWAARRRSTNTVPPEWVDGNCSSSTDASRPATGVAWSLLRDPVCWLLVSGRAVVTRAGSSSPEVGLPYYRMHVDSTHPCLARCLPVAVALERGPDICRFGMEEWKRRHLYPGHHVICIDDAPTPECVGCTEPPPFTD